MRSEEDIQRMLRRIKSVRGSHQRQYNRLRARAQRLAEHHGSQAATAWDRPGSKAAEDLTELSRPLWIIEHALRWVLSPSTDGLLSQGWMAPASKKIVDELFEQDKRGFWVGE